MGRWRTITALTTRAVPFGSRRRLMAAPVVSPLVARRSTTMSRTDGLTLTGTTAGVNDIFVIVLNPANATYTVDMIGTVDVTTDVDFSSGGYDFAGGNTAWNGFIPAFEELGGVFLDNNSPTCCSPPNAQGLTPARSTPLRLPAALAELAAAPATTSVQLRRSGSILSPT